MNPRGRFCGASVLVTGGASGIGAACSRLFASEGARVAVADIDHGAALALAGALLGAIAVHLDVSDEAQVEEAIAGNVETFGGLDIVVNNAGITGALIATHDAPVKVWDEVSAVNGRGIFLVLKHAIAHMREHGGGAIVNLASISGLVASAPDAAAYVYSKTGIVGLTRAVACDYACDNIRVNAVAPGQVLTPLVERLIAESPDPQAERAFRENRHAKPGFIAPEDIAAAVAFLASDDARWITGVTLPVDGGYTAR